MTQKKIPGIFPVALGVTAALVVMMLLYTLDVRRSLWSQAVTDILEVTTQGQRTLDTFVEKDYDTIRLFANEMTLQPATNLGRIYEKMAVFSDSDDTHYVCIDRDRGIAYFDMTQGEIPPSEMETVGHMAGQGMLEPFYETTSNTLLMGGYKTFYFGDNVSGAVAKLRPAETVSDQFTLSLYGDAGFSYMMRADGTILLPSDGAQKDASNLFDRLTRTEQGGDTTEEFCAALKAGERGVAQFRYQGTNHVFCYVPLNSVAGWYVVAVVPNQVIMAQADEIITQTMFLCGLILVGIALILLVYRRGAHRHEQEIERIAYYDTLTGLFTQEKFQLEGAKLMKNGANRHWAVLYLDIAQFKMVNDIHGYQYGDGILSLLAELLLKLAQGDSLTTRISADHFAVLISYEEKAELSQYCRHIAAESVRQMSGGRAISLRFGICCQEDAPEAEDIANLLDRSRIARDGIKDGGESDICFYNAEMRAVLVRKAEIESVMEQALSDGEFIFYIQPKFDVTGRQVLGGEALARWLRPGRGVVGPGDFIPLFERNGFVLQLDEHVFTGLCQALRRRIDAGLPVVTISVNVSRAHLYQQGFVGNYIRIKEEYHIPDGLVELELTESILMDDISMVRPILEELREAGFPCSIDDFGSGYSSLNALKDLPTDVIKLDKEFLTESDTPEKDRIIVRCVIGMAKELRMTTVAEGVEQQQQLDFLQTTGCDLIQGFIFSKPLPLDQFNALLDR